MIDNRFPRTTVNERDTRKRFLSAGTMYGLVFGLSFALLTWGYDALLLSSHSVALAWNKLLLGMPLAIIIASLTGRFAVASSSMVVSTALWATAGALMGMVAGHVPFDGGNLAAWLADRELWGLVIFPYGSSAATRTALVTVIGAGMGAAAGIVERLVVGWIWDQITPSGKIGGRAWLALLACTPLTLPIFWATDDLVNQPLRALQQTTDEIVTLVLAGTDEEAESSGLNYFSVARHRERLSDQYTVHLVEYDLDTYYTGLADIAFDNGFSLRCLTTAGQVGYCSPISDTYQDWMNELVRAGLYGERAWLNGDDPSLVVDEAVITWLNNHSDQLGETFASTRSSQHGAWIFMSARFDTGFEIECRFRGTTPVAVDQCAEANT